MPAIILLALNALYTLIRYFLFNFFTRIWAFILFSLPILFEKGLKLLGIGLISYTGFDFFIDKLFAYVMARLNGLPSDLLQILLILKLDIGIKLIFTAMTIALSIKIATAGSKLAFKKNNLEA